jgi:hypothetical protein
MLTAAIWAIGCNYSRHPALYQAPFFTPAKASEFFVQKALAAVPPFEARQFATRDSVEVCQAAILLTACDFSVQKCRNWMMFGIATRLAMRYEVWKDANSPDLLSVNSTALKVDVECTPRERRRIW